MASKNPKLDASSLEAHRQGIHALLGQSQKHLGDNATRLEAVVKALDARHGEIKQSLPVLARRARTAVGEERDVHHRAYLDAAQSLHRTARLHNSAMHELIRSRNG